MYKCINKKDSFKNLTVNKDYEGEEMGNFIEVVNDSNVKARYDKKYFEIVVPRPRVRRLSITDFINEFITTQFRIVTPGWEINIEYPTNNISYTIYFDTTRNSCGIRFIDGIENLIDLIDIIRRNLPENVEIDNNNDSVFLVELLKKCISAYERNDGNFAFYMFTTNDTEREILSEFNNLFTHTEDERNPNSGHNIRVWVASHSQLFD